MSRMNAFGAALTALLLVGGGAAAVVAAENVQPPATEAADPVRVHPVPAGLTRLACAPAPVIAEGAVAYDDDFNPIPVTSTASLGTVSVPRDAEVAEGADAEGAAGSAEAAAAELVAGGEATPLEGESARVAGAVRGAEAPEGTDAGTAGGVGVAVVAEPVDGVAPLVAAGGIWRSDTGDLRSLTALPCAPAGSEQWLVGGSTTVGSSALLTLANPGDTPITVTVTGWGQLGPVDLPMLTGMVIAPQESEEYLVEASDATLERLALRVQATGGVVGASLLDTRLDGFTARGTDTVAPTAAPALELVIPAMVIAAPPEGVEDPPVPGVVRILNPGSEPALTSLTLLTADGESSIPGADSFWVDPGAVFDIALDGLPPGEHAVAVSADQPVVAAAELRHTLADGGTERAWVSAIPAAQRLTLATPGLRTEADSAVLVLTNGTDGDATARVTHYGGDGQEIAASDVVVPARGTATVTDLEGTAGLAVDATAGVHGALVLRAEVPEGPMVAVLVAEPDAAATHEVRVRVAEE